MQVTWIGGAVTVHGTRREQGVVYDFDDRAARDLIRRGFARARKVKPAPAIASTKTHPKE